MPPMHSGLPGRDTFTLGARALLGLFGALAALNVFLRDLPASVRSLSNSRFLASATTAFALLHLALFLPLCIFHVPLHGDLPSFYLPQARGVLAGKTPYLDFYTSYGPLHAYVGGALLHVWNSGYVLVLFQIVCSIASLPVWIAALRRWFPEDDVRRTALLVLAQPMLLWAFAIDGRNDAMSALLLGLAALFLARFDLLAGVFATLPLVAVKFIPLLLLPPYLGAARRRIRWIIGALLLPVAIFGWLIHRGADILLAFKVEGSLTTAGGMPYAFTALTGIPVSPAVSNDILALACVATFLWMAKHAFGTLSEQARGRLLMTGIVSFMLVLLFFSKKSFPVYLVAIAFPLAIVTLWLRQSGARLAPWVYAAIIFFGMIQSTVWYQVMGAHSAISLHATLVTGNAVAAIETLIMLLPALCYLYLLAAIFRHNPREVGRSAQALSAS